jgi:hypothetical protein
VGPGSGYLSRFGPKCNCKIQFYVHIRVCSEITVRVILFSFPSHTQSASVLFVWVTSFRLPDFICLVSTRAHKNHIHDEVMSI